MSQALAVALEQGDGKRGQLGQLQRPGLGGAHAAPEDERRPGAKLRARPPKGVQVRPEDLRSWLVAALQKRGEATKAVEVAHVDTNAPDIVARLKAIAGKEAWHEVVVTSTVKGTKVGKAAPKTKSLSAASRGVHPRLRRAAPELAPTPLAPVLADVRIASRVLRDVAPRIDRRVRRRLAAPDLGGLLPLRDVAPGCSELLAGALERWLEAVLAACASFAKTAAVARLAATSDVSAACGALETANVSSGAAVLAHSPGRPEDFCVSAQHIRRWLTVGGGILPAPFKWPTGVQSESRVDAERALLQHAAIGGLASPLGAFGFEA